MLFRHWHLEKQTHRRRRTPKWAPQHLSSWTGAAFETQCSELWCVRKRENPHWAEDTRLGLWGSWSCSLCRWGNKRGGRSLTSVPECSMTTWLCEVGSLKGGNVKSLWLNQKMRSRKCEGSVWSEMLQYALAFDRVTYHSPWYNRSKIIKGSISKKPM